MLDISGGGSFARARACSAVASRYKVQRPSGSRDSAYLSSEVNGGSLDPVEPVAGTMLQQELTIFPRSKLLIIEQGVPVGDAVNGAVDLTIKAP
jgi:hypothetical protein